MKEREVSAEGSLEIMPLSENELRRSTYTAVLMALLIPPAVGGTIMGLVGFYPFPEIYLVFTSYSGAYVAIVVLVGLTLAAKGVRFVVSLTELDLEVARYRAKTALESLPWVILGCITAYSIFGALSADLSIETLGFREYTWRDHLYNQFGLVPVILISVFPIFFHYIDRLGRYLGPRGINVVAVPMWVKLFMLGIVTPLLIDSLLIAYFFNRTGYFEWQTLVLWFSLLGLAAGGTWIAWRSLQQSIMPLQTFIQSTQDNPDVLNRESLIPLSLDELGVLTSRYAGLLARHDLLVDNLEQVEDRLPLMDAVLASSLNGFAMADLDGRLIYVNPAFLTLWDYQDLSQVLGKHAEEFCVNRPEAQTAIKELLKHGSWRGEILARRSNNSEFVAEISASLVRNKKGNPTHLLGAFADVTERQRIQMALRDSEERLRLALVVSNQGLYDLDVQTGDAIVTPEYAMMLGYDPEEFHETNEAWRQRLHPDDQSQVYQVYTDYISGKRTDYRVEFRLRTRNGGWKWILSIGRIVAYDGEGRPLRMLGTHTDISERKQNEEKLLENEARLREMNEHLEDLVTLRASELRDERNFVSTVLDTAAALVLVCDDEGRIVRFNYACEQTSGYSFDEVRGEYLWQRLLPEDVRDVTKQVFSNLSKDSLPVTYQSHWLTSGGKRRFISWNNSLIHDSANKIRYVVSVGIDITERDEIEQRLAEANRIAQLGHWLWNIKKHTVSWSEEVYRLFGYNPETTEPSYALFEARIHPDDQAAMKSYVQSVMGETRTTGIDYRVVHTDGSIRWLHGESKVLRDATGEAFQLSGTVQDITERKQAEADLIAAKELAERASRAKSEFLSRMSHELRTPLNAILGFSQILEYESLNPEQHDFVSEIYKAGDHLLELINELLDLSRIETGHLSVMIEAVSLARIFNDAIKLITPLLMAKNIALLNHCENEWNVLADPIRLKQVLVNLLTNAVKYNRDGGSIQLECQQVSEKALRFDVADTGQGIDPEKLPLLFTPFERLGAEYTEVEGTGIGLALSKRMIELMGGAISVNSKPGQGTRFSVDLPLATFVMPLEPVLSESVRQVANRRLVLYVEDSAANLKVVKAMLCKHPDFTLVSATNGRYGLELAMRYHPDVILLDIHLPEMDGYTVLKALRAETSTKHIPVIALSADALPLDVERGFKAGFFDYLIKPVKMEALLKALSNVAHHTKP